jgi:hypothetical protein
MNSKEDYPALKSRNRSQGQKARQAAIRKGREDEIKKKAEEYLSAAKNRYGSVGRFLSSNRDGADLFRNEEEDVGENGMVEEMDHSEGQDLFNINNSSFDGDGNSDHQNDLGGDTLGGGGDEEESAMKISDTANSRRLLAKDIRNFLIPVADNFANREEAAKAVQLFNDNYQHSALLSAGDLWDLKAKVSKECSARKRRNVATASNSSMINDGISDELDDELLKRSEDAEMLNFESSVYGLSILGLNFDDNDDDPDDEDYNPNNHLDAAFECYDYELDEERRAEEMDESESSSVDDEGTLCQMQENEMEFETNPYEGFDILESAERINRLVLQQQNPSDDDDPLIEGSNSTKGEFCRDIQAFLTVNNIGASKAAKDALIKMLYKHIPALNLPIYLNRRKNQCQKLDSYVDPDLRNLSFDCCKSGCTVFVGKAYADLDHCANRKCNSSRYLPCAKEPCKSRPDQMCNHSKKDRVAVQKLYYRPIIPLIAMLLKTEGFLTALQYEYVQYSGQQFGDLSDGTSFKNHLKQMKEDIFDGFFDGNRQYRKQDYVFVPLLFGKNYDGVQVYSSKHSYFHPLFLSILNVPPSYRNKAGKH